MTPAAIELANVSKRYRYFALDDVSFRLEPGQIMGFVGPNGAGKSTTMRILMGLTRHDAGDVRVLGHVMPDQQVQVKCDVAFVSDEMRLFGGATLAWHMAFMQSIYPAWDQAYAAQLIARFHLHPDQPAKALSRGEHVKALLLLALSRRPRLMVLDEPTAGLDPVARHEVIAELMDVLRDDARAILFSSHDTKDVEQICDQITFIDRGRIVDSSDTATFVDCWRRISLDVPTGITLPALPDVIDVARSGQMAVVTTNRFDPALVAAFQATGAVVHDVQRMTLEEIFVANVMRKRKEGAA